MTWAPTHMTYGDNNRSCMLRLPQNRFCIENRAADMCMNPYLSLAMTTAAAVAGVIEDIDPGPPLNKDLYGLSDDEIGAGGGERLPRNLLEATEILRNDPLAAEVLGPAMAGFLATLQDRRVGALPPGGDRTGKSRSICGSTRRGLRPGECGVLSNWQPAMKYSTSARWRSSRASVSRTHASPTRPGARSVQPATTPSSCPPSTRARIVATKPYIRRVPSLDPSRFFIVSIDMFGNGLSSSPSNTPPPFDGPRFPGVALYDNVRCQHRLLTEVLGVNRLALVLGWSMAGCQSYQWGAQFPDMVAAILPFCASRPRTSGAQQGVSGGGEGGASGR